MFVKYNMICQNYMQCNFIVLYLLRSVTFNRNYYYYLSDISIEKVSHSAHNQGKIATFINPRNNRKCEK